MANRVYILMNVEDGRAEHIAHSLRRLPGVVAADPLDSPPDVAMVMEARDARGLAQLAVEALASVEAFIEDLRLLPSRSRLDTGAF